MSKRSKACAISQNVKEIVWNRDKKGVFIAKDMFQKVVQMHIL